MSREPSAAVDRTTTRRSALASLGALVAGGATVGVADQEARDAQQSGDAYRLRQGDDAVTVEPFTGETPVADLYDYRLPAAYVSPDGDASAESGPYYQSVGTRSLQRSGTTVSFLYDGPEGLSLVVVHDRPGDDGGAVTWQIRTRPEAVEWLVRDDRYRRPDASEPATTNYDAWASEGRRHRVDWTWGPSATDGGVLGRFPEEFALAVDPYYGERARLHGEHYDGAVTDWEFLSGSPENPTRHALATDEPVAITGNWTGPDPLASPFPGLGTNLSSVDTDASPADGSAGTQADDASTEVTPTEAGEGGDDATTTPDDEDESGTGGDDESGTGDGDDWHDDEWDGWEEWEREDERDDETDRGGEDERDENEDDEDEEPAEDDGDGPPSWANDDGERDGDDRNRGDGQGRGPPPWANDDGERDEDDEQREDERRGRGPPPWANDDGEGGEDDD